MSTFIYELSYNYRRRRGIWVCITLSGYSPGCHSQGETIEAAIANIQDAIRGCIAALDNDLLRQNLSRKEYYFEVAI